MIRVHRRCEVVDYWSPFNAFILSWFRRRNLLFLVQDNGRNLFDILTLPGSHLIIRKLCMPINIRLVEVQAAVDFEVFDQSWGLALLGFRKENSVFIFKRQRRRFIALLFLWRKVFERRFGDFGGRGFARRRGGRIFIFSFLFLLMFDGFICAGLM